jgi:hypothetical protein
MPKVDPYQMQIAGKARVPGAELSLNHEIQQVSDDRMNK